MQLFYSLKVPEIVLTTYQQDISVLEEQMCSTHGNDYNKAWIP